jgi:hypothetical protein
MGLAVLAVAGFAPDDGIVTDEVRTKRLIVLDDAGRAWVEIGEDPTHTHRRSRLLHSRPCGSSLCDAVPAT